MSEAVVDGFVKYREGKKWKSRWCVIRKQLDLPPPDVLHLALYKNPGDKQEKLLVPLQDYFGIESFHLDKEAHVLSILCAKQPICLAFPSLDSSIHWEIQLRKILGTEKVFPAELIKCPAGVKLPLGSALRLYLLGQKLCFSGTVPPRVLISWHFTELRRYGLVDGKFAFEAGSRCGKNQGLYVLLSGQGCELQEAFRAAAHASHAPNPTRCKRRSSFTATSRPIASLRSSLQNSPLYQQRVIRQLTDPQTQGDCNFKADPNYKNCPIQEECPKPVHANKYANTTNSQVLEASLNLHHYGLKPIQNSSKPFLSSFKPDQGQNVELVKGENDHNAYDVPKHRILSETKSVESGDLLRSNSSQRNNSRRFSCGDLAYKTYSNQDRIEEFVEQSRQVVGIPLDESDCEESKLDTSCDSNGSGDRNSSRNSSNTGSSRHGSFIAELEKTISGSSPNLVRKKNEYSDSDDSLKYVNAKKVRKRSSPLVNNVYQNRVENCDRLVTFKCDCCDCKTNGPNLYCNARKEKNLVLNKASEKLDGKALHHNIELDSVGDALKACNLNSSDNQDKNISEQTTNVSVAEVLSSSVTVTRPITTVTPATCQNSSVYSEKAISSAAMATAGPRADCLSFAGCIPACQQPNYTNIPPPQLPPRALPPKSQSVGQNQVHKDVVPPPPPPKQQREQVYVQQNDPSVALDPRQPLKYVDLSQYDGLDDGYLYWDTSQTEEQYKNMGFARDTVDVSAFVGQQESSLRRSGLNELEEDYVNLAGPESNDACSASHSRSKSEPDTNPQASCSTNRKGWHGYDNVSYPVHSQADKMQQMGKYCEKSDSRIYGGLVVDNRPDSMKIQMDKKQAENASDYGESEEILMPTKKKSKSWFKDVLSYHGSLKRPKSKRGASLGGDGLMSKDRRGSLASFKTPASDIVLPRRPSSAHSSPAACRAQLTAMTTNLSGIESARKQPRVRRAPPQQPPPTPPSPLLLQRSQQPQRNFDHHIYAVPMRSNSCTNTQASAAHSHLIMRTHSAPTNAHLAGNLSNSSMDSAYAEYMQMGPGSHMTESDDTGVIYIPMDNKGAEYSEMRSRNCSFSSTVSSGSSGGAYMVPVTASEEDPYMDMSANTGMPKRTAQQSCSAGSLPISLRVTTRHVTRSVSVKETAARPRLLHSRSLDDELDGDDDDEDHNCDYMSMSARSVDAEFNYQTSSGSKAGIQKPFDDLVDMPLFPQKPPPRLPQKRMQTLQESPERNLSHCRGSSSDDGEESSKPPSMHAATSMSSVKSNSKQGLFSKLMRRNSRLKVSKSQEDILVHGGSSPDEDYAQISESDMDPSLPQAPTERRSSVGNYLDQPPLPPRSSRERSFSIPSRQRFLHELNLTDEQKQHGGGGGGVLLGAVPPAPGQRGGSPGPPPPPPRPAATLPKTASAPQLPPKTYRPSKPSENGDKQNREMDGDNATPVTMTSSFHMDIPTYTNTSKVAVVDSGCSQAERADLPPGLTLSHPPDLPDKRVEHRRQASLPWCETETVSANDSTVVGRDSNTNSKAKDVSRLTAKKGVNLVVNIPRDPPSPNASGWLSYHGCDGGSSSEYSDPGVNSPHNVSAAGPMIPTMTPPPLKSNAGITNDRQRFGSNTSETMSVSSFSSSSDAQSLRSSTLGDDHGINSCKSGSPVPAMLRPRFGKDCSRMDRKKLADESDSPSPAPMPLPGASPSTNSSVFTFDVGSTVSSSRTSFLSDSCSTDNDSPKSPSIASRMSVNREPADHVYMNICFPNARSGSPLIVDTRPGSALSGISSVGAEQSNALLNYAEIDLSGSGGEEGSKGRSSNGRGQERVEYAMIDMVATAAASRVGKEHAKEREDSLRRRDDSLRRKDSFRRGESADSWRRPAVKDRKVMMANGRHRKDSGSKSGVGKDRKFSSPM